MSEFGVGVFDLEQGENQVKREIDYEEISSVKPRILLMGLQRSGKSSIQKVRYLLFSVTNFKHVIKNFGKGKFINRKY